MNFDPINGVLGKSCRHVPRQVNAAVPHVDETGEVRQTDQLPAPRIETNARVFVQDAPLRQPTTGTEAGTNGVEENI
ncbi:hypothetical protein [Tahibacter amnicola]|uniref:Uncharacterized protein n=1 Tax=Tahibacter amnicola TaxID=2976241 RepID=A0ABY6BCE3_9GAMM|nr:hypothetical protein [Tahibacter amnicola]UXI67246.1 hypothetical protein N4264_21275 [Tahibacter amnicola]